MAHTDLSDTVTDLDSSPVVKVNSQNFGGVKRSYTGYLSSTELVAGTAAQTYALVRVPARARVTSIKMSKASSGAAGSIKIGLFRPEDGIAIDDDCFTAAVDMNSAQANTEVMSLTAAYPTAANLGSDLATALSTAVGTAGATGNQYYDIVATVVTAATAGKDTFFDVEVVLPE